MGGNCCGLARYQTVITIGGWPADGRRVGQQGEIGRSRSRKDRKDEGGSRMEKEGGEGEGWMEMEEGMKTERIGRR